MNKNYNLCHFNLKNCIISSNLTMFLLQFFKNKLIPSEFFFLNFLRGNNGLRRYFSSVIIHLKFNFNPNPNKDIQY